MIERKLKVMVNFFIALFLEPQPCQPHRPFHNPLHMKNFGRDLTGGETIAGPQNAKLSWPLFNLAAPPFFERPFHRAVAAGMF